MSRMDRIVELTAPGVSFRPRRAGLLRDDLAELNGATVKPLKADLTTLR